MHKTGGYGERLLMAYAPEKEWGANYYYHYWSSVVYLIFFHFISLVNVALQKSASQSSQCCGGSPGRAVDGNSDGDFSNGLSCSHTAEATDPWWRVDLGSSQSVSEVFLVNRISGQARLSDIEIRVGKELLFRFHSKRIHTNLLAFFWIHGRLTYSDLSFSTSLCA